VAALPGATALRALVSKRSAVYETRNWERIKDLRLEDGSKPEVVALPMPSPLCFDGVRLPASGWALVFPQLREIPVAGR